jgi:hypothetical protein
MKTLSFPSWNVCGQSPLRVHPQFRHIAFRGHHRIIRHLLLENSFQRVFFFFWPLRRPFCGGGVRRFLAFSTRMSIDDPYPAPPPQQLSYLLRRCSVSASKVHRFSAKGAIWKIQQTWYFWLKFGGAWLAVGNTYTKWHDRQHRLVRTSVT